ncbi:MAG: YobA family protein, partial [Symbiobacteriaceae bacterium]
MKGKAWWVVLVVAGALAATAGFLRTSADRPARPEELEGSRPDDPPAIRGVITQVEPLAPPPSPAGSGTGATAGAAAGAGSDHWRILVEEHRTAGNGAQPSNGAGSTRSPLPIWLTVDDQTQVGASVGRHFVPLPAEGALQPGQSVRAWIRGGIRKSYPAQADAGTVLV